MNKSRFIYIFNKEKPVRDRMDILNIILSFLNIALLAANFLFLAYSTNKTSDRDLQQNLQPVILRDGLLTNDWNSLAENGGIKDRWVSLKFEVYENIAAEIRGYIVINNKKYKLNLGDNTPNPDPNIPTCSLTGPTDVGINFGWMSVGTRFCAVFDPSKYEQTQNLENQVCLLYKDIQGNDYYLKEKQTGTSFKSGKLENDQEICDP